MPSFFGVFMLYNAIQWAEMDHLLDHMFDIPSLVHIQPVHNLAFNVCSWSFDVVQRNLILPQPNPLCRYYAHCYCLF